MRVLPEPVGPRNSRLPTGRPGEFNPAQNTWYRSTSACTPSSWPTIFERSEPSKSRESLLRMLGLSCCRTAGLIKRPLRYLLSHERPVVSRNCCMVRIAGVRPFLTFPQTWGNPCNLNELQTLSIAAVSHGVRLCFIQAQSESSEAVCVGNWKTKRGVSVQGRPFESS